MDQETTLNEPATEPTATTETVTTEEVRNPEAVLAKNKELLGQLKSLKSELTEFKTAQESAREQKLAEEGKYKELLEEKEKQLADLVPVKEKADNYDAYFEKRLEEAKEGLTEIQIKAVEGFNGSLADKVAMADEFKGVTPTRTSSPGAERPGSNTSPKFNLDDYLGSDGAEKLTKLRYDNKDLWEEVIRAKNKRA